MRSYLKEERSELLQLLSSLTAEEWMLPTAAAEWNVKGVVLHLLDDDLGWLSRLRDRELSGRLDVHEYRSFVDALNAKNQRWILGTWGLSPRVIIDLLEWSGNEMDRWWATIDLMDSGGVNWASDGEVPRTLDIAIQVRAGSFDFWEFSSSGAC
ncbi:DinB family protein [Paenarthrobacter sp. Z7-10]|uniref:DinB family protein n=1 Tax=Paenarthrobacter sp. Z7-10 TaxID=2787635 RepID=UPI0022A9D9D6|nr:DinB family protein [Paenarthrobacter sp. Z7-10]